MTIWRVELTRDPCFSDAVSSTTWIKADFIVEEYDRYNMIHRVEFRNKKRWGRSELSNYVPRDYLKSISIVEKEGQ